MIKQNTHEKKNKKNTIPEALISTKEKHITKEKPIQRMERFGTRPIYENFGNRAFTFGTSPKWTPMHECPALHVNCNRCGEIGHYAKASSQKTNNNRTAKKPNRKRNERSDEL